MATGGSRMEEVKGTINGLEGSLKFWGGPGSSPVKNGAGSGPGPAFCAPGRRSAGGSKGKGKSKMHSEK